MLTLRCNRWEVAETTVLVSNGKVMLSALGQSLSAVSAQLERSGFLTLCAMVPWDDHALLVHHLFSAFEYLIFNL